MIRAKTKTQKNTEPIRKLWICILWMSAGLLSWYLSAFLFTYVVSPAFIKPVRAINAMSGAPIIKTVANMLFVYFSDFLLCFMAALILSFYTRTTKTRLVLFILGAIVFRLVAQADIAMSHLRHYSALPPWALKSLLPGLIPPLLIIPLVSMSACRLGRFIRMKR